MAILFGLIRHGRAAGQGPQSELLPEGAAYVTNLGRRLRREGWSPGAAFTSPYQRAVDTLRIVLGELASDVVPERLPELTPEQDPERALEALLARPLPSHVLVVAHNPLLGRLADELTGEPVQFDAGTFAAVELDARRRQGRLVQVIGPRDL